VKYFNGYIMSLILTAGKTAKDFHMKKGRLVLVLLVLMMVSISGVFAEEKQGYIKPTFSAGFATGKVEGFSTTLTALALDADFVSPIGLTFGLQNIMAWNDDVGASPFIAFGLGYTYTASRWSAGGKLMAIPFGNGGIVI